MSSLSLMIALCLIAFVSALLVPVADRLCAYGPRAAPGFLAVFCLVPWLVFALARAVFRRVGRGSGCGFTDTVCGGIWFYLLLGNVLPAFRVLIRLLGLLIRGA